MMSCNLNTYHNISSLKNLVYIQCCMHNGIHPKSSDKLHSYRCFYLRTRRCLQEIEKNEGNKDNKSHEWYLFSSPSGKHNDTAFIFSCNPAAIRFLDRQSEMVASSTGDLHLSHTVKEGKNTKPHDAEKVLWNSTPATFYTASATWPSSFSYNIVGLKIHTPSQAIASPMVWKPVGHSHRKCPGRLIHFPRWQGEGFISSHSLISRSNETHHYH